MHHLSLQNIHFLMENRKDLLDLRMLTASPISFRIGYLFSGNESHVARSASALLTRTGGVI